MAAEAKMKTLILTNKKGKEIATDLGIVVSNGSFFGQFQFEVPTSEAEVIVSILKEENVSCETREIV